MSNIPEARRILQEAIAGDNSYDSTSMYCSIVKALELLDRKKPAFRASANAAGSLSEHQRAVARTMRASGMALGDIARRLNTNIGRVSEAINEKQNA